MTKTVAVLGTALLCLLVICGTVLALLGKDPSVVFTFAASTIIPTASILYFGQKVEKTQNAAETVVAQTNGRMTELIAANAELSRKVAVLSGELPPEKFSELSGDEWPDEDPSLVGE